MNHRLYLLLPVFVLTGCNAHACSPAKPSADPLEIERFDRKLFEYITASEDTARLRQTLLRDYPNMLDLTGKGILNLRSIDSPGFFEKLKAYYSNTHLIALYKDALSRFAEVDEIERQLGRGFSFLKECFPEMKAPRVYMHVSGLNQNVLTGENTLSLSIDKYLGYDYPLYEDFFYPYQRIKMQPEYVAQDYLAGWLMSEFLFTGKDNVLLERMLHAGKIKYLLHGAFPDLSPAQLMGYTEEEYRFVEEHEAAIWQTIIERKHLYTPDLTTSNQYFEEKPSPFFSDGAPGNIGAFIGWQIIERYVKETSCRPAGLMRAGDAQEILSLSRYRP
ncbi:MAG: gliding motility protein GldB [Tannerellaceae bacterium]|jgi:hypothetical protein|nr:gliding motility protein GldB [Tannerellaceae bacterium]